MHKHHKHKHMEPDELASWRTWLNHQYDPGYWPSTGRIPVTRHSSYGCLFVPIASFFILAALASLLNGNMPNGGAVLGGLLVGGLLLAWGVLLLRKTQHKGIPRHRRHRRH